MLFHFSEEPDIDISKPRPYSTFPHLDPVVFAIDQEHAVHYYFPRDCPRVIYWKTESASSEDIETFFADTEADKFIAVENRWLSRIQSANLYKYTFPADTFERLDQTAGYYISKKDIVPVKVEPVRNLLEGILAERVELRFTPNLLSLRNRVIGTTLGFSIIRFRHAIHK